MHCILQAFFLLTFVFQTVVLENPKLLLLLIDGLRYDAISNATLAGFNALKNRGVSADRLIPNFPSTGYPNYFSLLTGLYPEQHGVTDDFMYDYKDESYFIKGTTFNSNETAFRWHVNGEPFWKDAVNKGENVSLYWWPGCNGQNDLIPLEFCHHFDHQSLKNTEIAITTILDRFQNDTTDIALIHVDEVDFYGHEDGPFGEKYEEAVHNVDKLIQRLENQLTENNMQDAVDIVLLSVYGFSLMTRPTTVIELSDLLPELSSYLSTLEGGSHVALYPPKDQILQTFNRLYGRRRHLKVYWKWNTPEHLKIRNGPHAAPVLVVADPGWIVATTPKEALNRAINRDGYNGYDPDESEDMCGVFIAAGPSFKSNATIDSIHINDLYNVLRLVSGSELTETEMNNTKLANSLLILNENQTFYNSQERLKIIHGKNESKTDVNSALAGEKNDTETLIQLMMKPEKDNDTLMNEIPTTDHTETVMITHNFQQTDEFGSGFITEEGFTATITAGSGDEQGSGGDLFEQSTTNTLKYDVASGDDEETTSFTMDEGSGEKVTDVTNFSHQHVTKLPKQQSNEESSGMLDIEESSGSTDIEQKSGSDGGSGDGDGGGGDNFLLHPLALDDPTNLGRNRQFNFNLRLPKLSNLRFHDDQNIHEDNVEDEQLIEVRRQQKPSLQQLHVSLISESGSKSIQRLHEGTHQSANVHSAPTDNNNNKQSSVFTIRKSAFLDLGKYRVAKHGILTRVKMQRTNLNMKIN